MVSLRLCFIAMLATTSGFANGGSGKLQETAGVTQLEGSGGGGLVPWATLSGYDSRDEWSSSVFMTRVSLPDYRLQAFGASASVYDRIEISLARQTFELKNVPFGEREINQQILGLKGRLYGDIVYGAWPQVALGIQYKELGNEVIASAVGAENTNSGTDIYLAASKAHLGALMGYNLVWDLTLRATKANQFGLLGYGGDNNDSYEMMVEASLATLFSRQLALGIEFRQKPDNLSALEEEDAFDIFLAYIPNKNFNITVAWTDLGTIAGEDDQTGAYVSLTGYLW
ncbi:DUF3034 family protein [Ketobacter alkanivorans]|uniref:DUF3034 domain-containing protein n=1 Tax=Ketobacter alkanivorans TaxID=1917421 RepID=A0A2K9LPA9_9GAMM|nr:DUF3034 family protein [Ketobacter alkanivorans]AUM14189.1 hypothetical protein Kalk_17955 [Ketobacter alkanivorans]